MPLSIRQTRLYTERVDLYRPVESTGSELTYELVASSVPAQIVPTDNFDTLQGATRLKQNNIQTSDSLHLHSGQACGEGWVLFVRPESVRYPGDWFVTLGAGEKHPYRAKYQRFYINNQLPLSEGQIV